MTWVIGLPYFLQLAAGALTKLKIDDIHIHRIRSGESMYKIARRYGISLKKLMSFNPKLKPRRIRPGTKVAVPIPSVKPSKG